VAAHPTRRVVLAAAAALPLAAASGCGVDVLSARPRPAPDVALLRSAIAAEQMMVARYTNVLNGVRNPGGGTPAAGRGGSPAALAAALEPVLAEHRAHLAQLRSRLIVPAGAAPLPSERVPADPAAPAAPAAPGAAVAFLRAAEQAAAADMLDRLPQAPASLAQLFASISASEATHVPVLDALLLGTGRTGG
jgi:Ferritin-like domain